MPPPPEGPLLLHVHPQWPLGTSHQIKRAGCWGSGRPSGGRGSTHSAHQQEGPGEPSQAGPEAEPGTGTFSPVSSAHRHPLHLEQASIEDAAALPEHLALETRIYVHNGKRHLGRARWPQLGITYPHTTPKGTSYKIHILGRNKARTEGVTCPRSHGGWAAVGTPRWQGSGWSHTPPPAAPLGQDLPSRLSLGPQETPTS